MILFTMFIMTITITLLDKITDDFMTRVIKYKIN